MEKSENYSTKEDFLSLVNGSFMAAALLFQGEHLKKAEAKIDEIFKKGKGLEKVPYSLILEIQEVHDKYLNSMFQSMAPKNH